jgi:hypothetical protein
VIRRFKHIRPALIFGFVLLWTFHFSFGMFTHYHPEYAHAHDGELQSHEHGGHFHSLELDTLARFLDSDEAPLRPGETHHHSETLPGSDSETAQYDFNHSGITKIIKLVLEFQPDATAVSFTPADLKYFHSQQVISDSNRTLLLLHNHSERSPPLRV